MVDRLRNLSRPGAEFAAAVLWALGAVSALAWLVQLATSKQHHPFTFWLALALGLAAAGFLVAWLRARQRITSLERAANPAEDLSAREKAEAQLAGALRTGHFLMAIDAPPLNEEWVAQTEQLLREAVGELAASRLPPDSPVDARLQQLQELSDDVERGNRNIRPSATWERYENLYSAMRDVLELMWKQGRWIHDKFFFERDELTTEDAKALVDAWLEDLRKDLERVPALASMVRPRPYFAKDDALSEGDEPDPRSPGSSARTP